MERSVALCPLFLSSRRIVPADPGFCDAQHVEGYPHPLLPNNIHLLLPKSWALAWAGNTGNRIEGS